MDDKPMLNATWQRSPRWAVWKRLKLVTRDGVVYLDRLRLLQTPYFGIYLHWINGPDPDPDPHDHPWTFRSLVLRGGYTEHFYRSARDLSLWHYRVWSRWSWHRVEAEGVAHRIIGVMPRTLTLVIVGRRERNWGFWTDGGAMRRGGRRRVEWVPWEVYEKRPQGRKINHN